MSLVEAQLRCKATLPEGDTYGNMVIDLATGKMVLADED